MKSTLIALVATVAFGVMAPSFASANMKQKEQIRNAQKLLDTYKYAVKNKDAAKKIEPNAYNTHPKTGKLRR